MTCRDTPIGIVRDHADELNRIDSHHATELRLVADHMQRHGLSDDAQAAANLIKRRMHPEWLDGAVRECVERLIRTLRAY